MEPTAKTKVIKSKSSNSAITNKAEKGPNKKSLSDVEFKAQIVKKRGVYVEKRPSSSKQFAHNKNETQPKVRAPPRSKPENVQETKAVKQRNKSVRRAPQPIKESKEAKTSQMPPKNVAKNETKTKKDVIHVEKNKKPKYKSKALNEEVNKNPEKVLILQSRKEIALTPSNNSKCTKDGSSPSIKWAEFLPKLIDSETRAPINLLKKNSNLDYSIAKSVLEGNKLNNMVKNDDPTMAVSTPEADKHLYSLFVDILQTVYKDEPDFDEASSIKSNKTSKVHLEIDDKVADKLMVPTLAVKTLEDESSMKRLNQQYEDTVKNEMMLEEYYNSKPLYTKYVTPVKKQSKSDSLNFPKNLKLENPKARAEGKLNNKRNKKLNLLSMLKQQLKTEYSEYDEPENFYQALCVMARNKRKAIRFDGSVKGGKETDSDSDSVCRFKRRQVISLSTRLPKAKAYKPKSRQLKYPTAGRQYSEDSRDSRSYPESTLGRDKESHHSLEVYGFDYVPKRSLVGSKRSLEFSDTEMDSDSN